MTYEIPPAHNYAPRKNCLLSGRERFHENRFTGSAKYVISDLLTHHLVHFAFNSFQLSFGDFLENHSLRTEKLHRSIKKTSKKMKMEKVRAF